MVIPRLLVLGLPMIKIFDFSPYRIAYGLILLCGALSLSGGGTAFAANEHDHDMMAHDHGKANVQTGSAGPIIEVVLPEGLGSAQSVTIDPTGRVWFTEKIGKKLAVYDPEKKEFATYPLPASWGNMGFSYITSGSDGEIWFTVNRWAEGSEEPNMLGRFTPADGYFTKYALSSKTIPEELIVDAKGVIWFFAANKNNLYRVDPKTFALKGYPIPTANGYPRSLAVALNGHVWFVEANTNKIGEFIPDQEIFHEHEVLTSFANLGKISIDKNGKIWFVEVTANRIGVFSPEQKRFDEVIIPTPSSSPVALANDDNGNIWFLEYKGNKVGVFNTESAIFHEYDIPTYGSLPTEMVIDRKRSLLWFTQSSTEAKRLGMLSINETLAANNKQDKAPHSTSAEEVSNESMTRWLILLAAIIASVTLGGWLTRKFRKGRHS